VTIRWHSGWTKGLHAGFRPLAKASLWGRQAQGLREIEIQTVHFALVAAPSEFHKCEIQTVQQPTRNGSSNHEIENFFIQYQHA
jgi:hypothetical protein